MMNRGGVGVGLAPEGGQGEDRPGATIAKGNGDVAEMDCLRLQMGSWTYVSNLLAAKRS